MARDELPKDVVEKLSVRQTRAALTGVRYSLKKDKLKVFYRGRWLRLGRCDLLDQVRTYHVADEAPPSEDPLQEPRRESLFGAYVTKTAFFVIDSGTDG